MSYHFPSRHLAEKKEAPRRVSSTLRSSRRCAMPCNAKRWARGSRQNMEPSKKRSDLVGLKWGNPANLCFPLNCPSKPPQEGYPHTNGKPMHIKESSFALFGVQEHLHGSLARLRVPSRPNVPFANRVPARCKTRRRLCGVKLSS